MRHIAWKNSFINNKCIDFEFKLVKCSLVHIGLRGITYMSDESIFVTALQPIHR